MSARGILVAALLTYLAILVGVGIWTARRQKSSFQDYVTGGGSIPAWMLALSFMANFISSNSFVGHASKSYDVGLIWMVVAACMVACCFLSWFWFAPRFADFARTHGTTTLPEFFEQRFSSRALGTIVHWVVVFSTMFYLLAVMRGIAVVVQEGLSVSYLSALLIVYSVTIAYCVLGGLWADVSTDVLQAVVLTLGAIALMAAMLVATPQPGLPAAPALKPIGFGLVLATGLNGGMKLLTDPKQVMVFYAFRDAAAARRYRWVGPILLLVVYSCLFPLGWLARGIVPRPAELESLMPSLVFDHGLLGPLGALFLVSLLAASMSSLDSALLVVASCMEKHVVSPLTKTPASMLRARVLLFVTATIVLALSIRPLGSIIALTSFAGALIAAFLPAVVVGLAGREVPARAAIASVVLGVAGAVVGKTLPMAFPALESPWFQDVFVGLALATLALLPTARTRPRSLPSSSPGAS